MGGSGGGPVFYGLPSGGRTCREYRRGGWTLGSFVSVPASFGGSGHHGAWKRRNDCLDTARWERYAGCICRVRKS